MTLLELWTQLYSLTKIDTQLHEPQKLQPFAPSTRRCCQCHVVNIWHYDSLMSDRNYSYKLCFFNEICRLNANVLSYRSIIHHTHPGIQQYHYTGHSYLCNHQIYRDIPFYYSDLKCRKERNLKPLLRTQRKKGVSYKQTVRREVHWACNSCVHDTLWRHVWSVGDSPS